jgi:hypothetical protein
MKALVHRALYFWVDFYVGYKEGIMDIKVFTPVVKDKRLRLELTLKKDDTHGDTELCAELQRPDENRAVDGLHDIQQSQ